MKMDTLKILVCFYKEILIRTIDPVYLDLQCGKESTKLDLAMTPDNTGDNISSRNTYWSEITGLYWAWKNMEEAEYVGLCSYRRFFNFKLNPLSVIKILPKNKAKEIHAIEIPDLKEIFKTYDIIVPKPYEYGYTIKQIIDRNYKPADFEILKNTIHELSPSYDEAYDAVMNKTNKMIGHNMFILPWAEFNEYCEWVFKILLTVEKRIDPSAYPIHQVRVFGYMHEILLGVFIRKKGMRQYHSQLTWLTDNSEGFKFNSIFYKLAANLYYTFNSAIAKFRK